LTNYDWTLKSSKPDSQEDKKEEDKNPDERLKRQTKLIDNFEVSHEQNLHSSD
jgi:hypothetical protein